MNQNLSDTDIDDVLRANLYGHLGCIAPDGKPYVLPITYAYHGGDVYSFTAPGLKLDALRANPSVCLQVEQFLAEGAWRSVIVWGNFEEISGKDKVPALKILFEHLETEHGSAMSPLYRTPDADAVVYRIRVDRKTGRSVRNP